MYARSREWVCPRCQQSNLELLPDPIPEGSTHIDADATENPVSRHAPLPSEDRLPENSPFSDIAEHIVSAAPQSRSLPVDTVVPSAVSGHSRSNALHQTPSSSRVRIPEMAETSQEVRRRIVKAPLVLDTIICVLLVMVLAMIYRKVV